MGINIDDTLSNSLTTQIADSYACVDKLIQVHCQKDVSGNAVFTCACKFMVWNDIETRNSDPNGYFYSKAISIETADTDTMYQDLYDEVKTNFSSTSDDWT